MWHGGSAICVEVADVPGADQVPARVGVGLDRLDHPGDLVDVPAVGRRPGPPLVAVDRAELAVGVGPLVPDRDAVARAASLTFVDALEEPQQLRDHRAGVQLLGGEQREARRSGRTASGSRTRSACRCPVRSAFCDAVGQHVVQQVEVGLHRDRSSSSCRLPAPARRSARGTMARTAWPRWLMASLAAGVELAVGHALPVGHEQRVVAEAILTHGARRSAAPTSRRAGRASVPSGSTSAIAQTKRAVRSPVGDVGELTQQQLVVLLVGRARPGPAGRPDAGHPVQHVDRQPGVVGQGRQPGGRDAGPGLEQRVALEGRLGLGRLGIGRARRPGPSTSTPGAAAATIRRSSASFLALLVASTTPVCVEARDGRRLTTGEGGLLQLGQPRAARRAARSSSRPASSRSNGAPSAVPCTSMKLPVAAHHDVHVGVGGRVLGVAQVEHRRRRRRRRPRPPPPSRSAARRSSRLRSRSQLTASASATYAPVIDAVRVPPSACSTSQSSTIVFSRAPCSRSPPAGCGRSAG